MSAEVERISGLRNRALELAPELAQAGDKVRKPRATTAGRATGGTA